MTDRAMKIARARHDRGELRRKEYRAMLNDITGRKGTERPKKVTAAIVLLAVLLSVGAVSAAVVFSGQFALGGVAYGTISNQTFTSANHAPSGVFVGQRVIYINQSATILIEGTPAWYPMSGDYFLSYGVVNPTFVVAKGITVHFKFINMDNESHNFAIGSIPPPYPYMVMMPGSMMNAGQNSQWNGMTTMLGGYSVSGGMMYFHFQTIDVTFNRIGTYWYLCSYPGHAEGGMFGKIIVQ
jgi:rusticyanin